MQNKQKPNAESTNPPTGAAVYSDQRWREIARELDLPQREIQMIREAFNDETDYAIACKFGISKHTVHTYFERVYKKLGIANRAQLIVRVVQTDQALDDAEAARHQSASQVPPAQTQNQASPTLLHPKAMEQGHANAQKTKLLSTLRNSMTVLFLWASRLP